MRRCTRPIAFRRFSNSRRLHRPTAGWAELNRPYSVIILITLAYLRNALPSECIRDQGRTDIVQLGVCLKRPMTDPPRAEMELPNLHRCEGPMAKLQVANSLRLHRPTQVTACGLTRVGDIDLVQFQLRSTRVGWTTRRSLAFCPAAGGEGHLCSCAITSTTTEFWPSKPPL